MVYIAQLNVPHDVKKKKIAAPLWPRTAWSEQSVLYAGAYTFI